MPEITNSQYRKGVALPALAVSIIFMSIGIWGTYAYPTNEKAFYVFYIILSVGSVIIGSIIVPFLSKPITESLIEKTHNQLERVNKLVEETHNELKKTNIQIERIANIQESFKQLGISYASIDRKNFEWHALIGEASEINLAFKSSVWWLSTYKEELEKFLAKPNTKLNVILPDNSNIPLCIELGKQRKKSKDGIVDDISQAVKILQTLSHNYPEKVSCRATDTILLSHFYIFDRLAIVTIRSLHDSWASPHFICDKNVGLDNKMYNFCDAQFKNLWRDRSKQIIP